MLCGKVSTFAPYPKANPIHALRHVLHRPIGPAAVGDYDAEPVGTVRLELHGSFEPTVRREAHDEPCLVVLVDRVKTHGRGEGEIAHIPFAKEAMAVVDAETVMGSLPEIRPSACRNDKPRITDFVARRRIPPTQARGNRGPREVLIDFEFRTHLWSALR